MNSHSCVNTKNGKPLSIYYSAADARDGADHASHAYGTKLAPYQCDRCGMWHLSPTEKGRGNAGNAKCSTCVSRDQYPKDIYRSKQDAQNRATALKKEKGIRLKVYRCPVHDGWHLARGA